MSLTVAEAARRLGAKLSEIVEVEAIDGGHVVVTHDGTRTVIPDDPEAPLQFHTRADVAAQVEEARPAVEAELLDAQVEGREPELPEAPEEPDDPAAEVPEGSAAEVLEWVGDDSDRAARALQVEQASDKPRAGLSKRLEELAG